MNAKWATRLGLLLATVIGWLITCWVTTQTTLPHLAVGANVTGSGWFAQIFSLISASGLSVATAIAFLKQWAPAIQSAIPTLNLPSVINAAEAVELGLSVVAYLNSREDKGAQRRFALAAITELSDMVELKSPEIAESLSKLSAAMVAEWFPAPEVKGGAV